MHILVVNDDGPPSSVSPYVGHLVDALQARDHLVSVILPHTQRSWIGKAHLINETITCTESREPGQEGWIIANSSPAGCIQLGTHHFFKERGPIDLIVSGPNYGQNITALYAMSSGTLGGALEGALSGYRAIAISFDKPLGVTTDALVATARQGVKIIEALVEKWHPNSSVELYSINMPIADDISKRKVVWTTIFGNRWNNHGAFVEVGERLPSSQDDQTTSRTFRWGPRLDGADGFKAAVDGEDVWAIAQGYISITPLTANFSTPTNALQADPLVL
ncbi:unnamed protein product [Clonostachys rosea]|uniref:Survival protein SurE-like phosphatase/nucleotidase domain-containing protein n=1 Tax=Bionectria ochroleuca TaxID=29856 RepID=A0ABY6TYW1_BIOOC|nr:unnamed protein product [Clonostachys rosea]